MKLLVAFVLAVSCGIADPAASAELDQARVLYDQGAMLKAADLARGSETADGLALASQATLVAAVYQRPGGPDRRLLEQAADDARRALELDPDHVGAHLQLALAIGHIAEEDPLSAHLNGDAWDGKALLDRAIVLAPDDAWTHGMLGVWHLRLVKHAGPLLAENLYDATIDEGRQYCEKAASLAPEGIAIRFGCAISLFEAAPERYGGEAAEALDTVVSLPAEDAATRLVQEEAKRRLAALRSSPVD